MLLCSHWALHCCNTWLRPHVEAPTACMCSEGTTIVSSLMAEGLVWAVAM